MILPERVHPILDAQSPRALFAQASGWLEAMSRGPTFSNARLDNSRQRGTLCANPQMLSRLQHWIVCCCLWHGLSPATHRASADHREDICAWHWAGV